MRGEIEANRAKLEPWEALCAELGERPADVALAWLLHQPAVTAPIIGPRTEEQLLGSMRALDVELVAEVLASSTRSSRGRADRRPRPTPGSGAPGSAQAPTASRRSRWSSRARSVSASSGTS